MCFVVETFYVWTNTTATRGLALARMHADLDIWPFDLKYGNWSGFRNPDPPPPNRIEWSLGPPHICKKIRGNPFINCWDTLQNVSLRPISYGKGFKKKKLRLPQQLNLLAFQRETRASITICTSRNCLRAVVFTIAARGSHGRHRRRFRTTLRTCASRRPSQPPGGVRIIKPKLAVRCQSTIPLQWNALFRMIYVEN